MLSDIELQQLIIIDVETVPGYPDYKSLPEPDKKHWDRKSFHIQAGQQSAEALYQRAGIYAEFGKVICISAGRTSGDNFSITSFSGANEALILCQFISYLKKHSRPSTLLCAHNGKEFDFPYLGRRILINRLPLPSILDLAGKKPWEVKHLDTLELWKFGDYKHYTSLDLLTHLFGISSPKQEIDGSKIAGLWWGERNIKKIRAYCEQDVLAVMNIMRCYKGLQPLSVTEIEYRR
jgi:DNA polymerase elongation subunit (family B)